MKRIGSTNSATTVETRSEPVIDHRDERLSAVPDEGAAPANDGCGGSLADMERAGFPDLATAIRKYARNPTGDRSKARLTKAVKFSARLLLRRDVLEPGRTCKSEGFTGKTLIDGSRLLWDLKKVDESLCDSWTAEPLPETFKSELDRSAKSLWHVTQVRQLLSGGKPYAYGAPGGSATEPPLLRFLPHGLVRNAPDRFRDASQQTWIESIDAFAVRHGARQGGTQGQEFREILTSQLHFQ